VGILSGGNSLYSSVSNDQGQKFVMLVDPVSNKFTSVPITPGKDILDILEQNNISALITSGIGNRAKTELTGHGVKVYSGTVGRVIDVFQLYQSGKLVATK
jgi:predicted Fe-Mo cluster-binding NifX family protein